MRATFSEVVSGLGRETAKDILNRSPLNNVKDSKLMSNKSCTSVEQEKVLTGPSERRAVVSIAIC